MGRAAELLQRLPLQSKGEKRILLLGLDAAGKTTVLQKLAPCSEQSPTASQSALFNVETVAHRGRSLSMWDVGFAGRDKIRPLLLPFYKGVCGIIFVVDSSSADRMAPAREELEKILRAVARPAGERQAGHRPPRRAGLADLLGVLEGLPSQPAEVRALGAAAAGRRSARRLRPVRRAVAGPLAEGPGHPALPAALPGGLEEPEEREPLHGHGLTDLTRSEEPSEGPARRKPDALRRGVSGARHWVWQHCPIHGQACRCRRSGGGPAVSGVSAGRPSRPHGGAH